MQNNFWEDRYKKQNKIWGEIPSKSVDFADEIFKTYGIIKILIPGSGYGRNLGFFSKKGYLTTGIEISKTALDTSKKEYPQTEYINKSIIDNDINDFVEKNSFEGIYCFNVLHLLLQNERKMFIQNCYNWLKNGGIACFTVFSEKEKNYGKGTKMEENTFESKKGRPAHYFTENDLFNHFKKFKIINTRLYEEPENHGEEKKHVHKLRFIAVQK